MAAMLKRQKWAETKPDMVAKLRVKQRPDQDELRKIRDATRKPADTVGHVQLNSASLWRSAITAGGGSLLASRIVTHWPYKTMENLVRVPGYPQ